MVAADIVEFKVIINTLMTFLIGVEDHNLVVAVVLGEDGVEGEFKHKSLTEAQGLNYETKGKLGFDLLEVVKRVELTEGLSLLWYKGSIWLFVYVQVGLYEPQRWERIYFLEILHSKISILCSDNSVIVIKFKYSWLLRWQWCVAIIAFVLPKTKDKERN